MIHLAGTLAAFLAFLANPTASAAEVLPTGDIAQEEGSSTREWHWTVDQALTILTAQGPADQVAAFEPGDPTSECPDCVLMSSVAFEEPEDALPISADPGPAVDPAFQSH